MTETPSSETRVSATILMVALLAACVAFQLNASMLGPVLVTIAEELHTDEAAVSLSQTAFFTAAALFSLFLPRLSDIKGRKKVLSWMLAIMTAGTVLAALAPNITVLYIARVIQGVSGPVVPLCLLMLRHEISDAKVYGTLMGVVTAVNGGIAGIDAIAGGVLAANFGFRSVFWTITVVAAIATLMVMKWAPESKPSANVKMDWPGVILLVLSLAAMLIALGQAGNLAAANWLLVFGLAAFSVVMFIAFWQVEKRSEQPLVTTHYLKQRSILGAAANHHADHDRHFRRCERAGHVTGSKSKRWFWNGSRYRRTSIFNALRAYWLASRPLLRATSADAGLQPSAALWPDRQPDFLRADGDDGSWFTPG